MSDEQRISNQLRRLVVGQPARIGWLLAILLLGLDQLTKHWILYRLDLPSMGTLDVIGPARLTMVYNAGVSFGLLQAGSALARWGLVAFSLAIALGLAIALLRVKRVLTALAFGLVIGGAIGNAIDRIRFGVVLDFLDFTALKFPWVFNVADSGITIGVIILLVDSVLQSRNP